MANMANSKLKLLYILDILNRHTDEDNILTSNDIVLELEKMGLTAERRSVIRDIKTLVDYGYDISLYEENNIGYYMRSRDFEEEELQILIDSVIASKALSFSKTNELIMKLLSLSSDKFAKKVMERLCIDPNEKSENEKIYYNINIISEAITENKKVSFRYLTYDVNKEQKFKKEGKGYIVSPYALTWYEDNYYLIGVHEKYSNISHYRVDRISEVSIVDGKRKLADCLMDINDFNVKEYIDSTFNVFTGKKKKIKLKFTNDLMNAIIDKFGTNVYITPYGEEHCILVDDVIVSEGFISWILQFEVKIEILEPIEIRELVKEKILELIRVYEI
jgi:predicted DNA-binding transcriptional regulator YafY